MTSCQSLVTSSRVGGWIFNFHNLGSQTSHCTFRNTSCTCQEVELNSINMLGDWKFQSSSNWTFGQKTDFWHCAYNVWFIGKPLGLETKGWIFLCCCLPRFLKRPGQICQIFLTICKITIILQTLVLKQSQIV